MKGITMLLDKGSSIYINWGRLPGNDYESAALSTFTGKHFDKGNDHMLIFKDKTGTEISPISEDFLEGKCMDLGILKADKQVEVSDKLFKS